MCQRVGAAPSQFRVANYLPEDSIWSLLKAAYGNTTWEANTVCQSMQPAKTADTEQSITLFYYLSVPGPAVPDRKSVV